MAAFFVWSAGTVPPPVEWQRGLYVGATYVLILLVFPALRPTGRVATVLGRFRDRHPWLRRLAPSGGPTPLDLALVAATVVAVGYYVREFEALQFRAGAYTPTDVAVAAVGLLVSLEISRRVLGVPMTLIGALFVLYLRFGDRLYDVPVLASFAHRGRSWDRVTTVLYFDQEGVFGVMANVLVSYVIVFVFFGAFLRHSGASRFFLDLPLALAGRSTGGPAKVSVLASALFGSISGSAIANTVSTGTFTIPLMKKAGFRPHVAGAIEPAASIGGMFMPPIMGAGAFLMAELTRIPYGTIVLVSIFPAVLYFTSVLTMVHFEARRQGLRGGEASVSAREILRTQWFLSIPLLVIVALMVRGFSPGTAAFWGLVACIPLVPLRDDVRAMRRGLGTVEALRRTLAETAATCWRALVDGARDTLVIGATVGVIGILVGTIYATGIGLRFSDLLIGASGGSVLAVVAMIGLASLLLGMGVPVTAAYLIVAVLAVPALLELGVALIAAHMIVYWFSQDSNITPPVCVAAYAGAAIAGADPWKTGWTAFRYAKLLYVMPILFATSPALLLVGSGGEILRDLAVGDVVLAYASAFLGTVAFSSVTMGFLRRSTTVPEWIVLAVATVLCFVPSVATDLAGIGLFAGIWVLQGRSGATPGEVRT